MHYYIISLKHTSKGDSALTLWRLDGKGYCWYSDWAGRYLKEDTENRIDEQNVSVEVDTTNPLFEKTTYDGEERWVLPNTKSVREKLGLDSKLMKAKKYATCFMSF